MSKAHEYSYTYQDLAKATGLTRNAIAQHVVRGWVDPNDLESVVVYLARYGREDLRMEMVTAMMRRDIPDDPGGWKKKKVAKKKAPRKKAK